MSMGTSMPGSLQSGNSKERRVSIPGIGTAVQMSTGEVRVNYSDGTQLWVDGKHHIKYQYPDGNLLSYNDNENLPKYIIEKMQHMPKVLKHLMPTPILHRTHSIR